MSSAGSSRSAGLGLVYGGARVGLMGAVADGALAAGGEVIGVIPRQLVEHEIAHTGLTELREVTTMHERKALMADLSDAVIALPGGTGTLDELFELFTWSQLGLIRMPIGLLDVAGYWQPLLAMLDHMVAERLLRAEHRETLLVVHRRLRAPRPALRLRASRHRQVARSAGAGLSRLAGAQRVPKTRSPASPRPGRM